MHHARNGFHPRRNPCRTASPHPVRAFTLSELLLVIATCALLASLLMPALRFVRDKAESVRCASALRQVGLGAIAYSADNRGFRVATAVVLPTTPTTSQGWALLITPYFGTRQTLADGLTAGVFHGCPTWLHDPLYRKLLKLRGVSWMTMYGMGYSINSQPMRPVDPNATDDWGNIYVAESNKHDFRMAQIQHATQRILFAEDVKRSPNLDDVWTSSNEFYSGYGPESRQPNAPFWWGIWRRTPEAFRHRIGSNYVFFDGHAEYIRYPASLAEGNARGGPGLGQNDPADPRWLAR